MRTYMHRPLHPHMLLIFEQEATNSWVPLESYPWICFIISEAIQGACSMATAILVAIKKVCVKCAKISDCLLKYVQFVYPVLKYVFRVVLNTPEHLISGTRQCWATIPSGAVMDKKITPYWGRKHYIGSKDTVHWVQWETNNHPHPRLTVTQPSDPLSLQTPTC